ncbi:hypothetical protein ACFWIA_08750 [Streptomyces sp. NPDC127068]|uniref:hypothetical protein n=1 Tax=Streptomyces sp. NPDC127068 TaxID=3347127 RepID=UPI003668C3C0
MPPTPAPHDRDRHAWIAPLVSTLVTVPAALVALFFVGMSQMACDSCEGAELDRFDRSFPPAFGLFRYGLLLPAALLLTAWLLPARRKHALARVLLALVAPFVVAVLGLTFVELVDWP